MTLSEHSKSIKGTSTLVLALSLLLGMTGINQAANAQDSASAGIYNPSAALGSDQDSLLPPEVVPLDPATANSMSSAQAQQRQANQMSDAQVPGMVPNGSPNNGMQTSQQYRKAAFDQLYNQGNLQEPPLTQWRAGQQIDSGISYSTPGQLTPMNNQPFAPYTQQGPGNMAMQSQTLSGAPKNQPKVHSIKRAGFSNALSAMAGFGAGALTSSYMMSPQSMPMGLGMYGLTMTGFGVRNAFRF